MSALENLHTRPQIVPLAAYLAEILLRVPASHKRVVAVLPEQTIIAHLGHSLTAQTTTNSA